MKPAQQGFRLLFLLFCLTFSGACQQPAASAQNGSNSNEKTDRPAIPTWLQQKITAFENDEPANPPVKIYRYHYRQQPVYFISGRCCDIPGSLFNVEGQQLCQPDGGITGRGDGKCPDFFETRTNEKLIWEDLR
ncbi:MAG TPA: hypothetical protein VK927_07865 [Adhaeribacter sp.]|nr:hypothetical protein [Adhaeribacter sp.]